MMEPFFYLYAEQGDAATCSGRDELSRASSWFASRSALPAGIKKPAHEAPVLIALLESGGLHHTLGAQVILVGAAEVADAVFGQLQDAGR